MKRSVFLALPVFLLTVFFLSKTTLAEIATTKDWIGLFPSNTSGTCPSCDSKSSTLNGNSWVYANSCTKTPGTSPSLNNPGGCSFALNPVPASGNYEFRLYANDQQTPDALIAVSKAMSINPTPSPGGGVNCPTQITNPRVQGGLITTPNISNNFGNSTATCVIGNPASFVPYKIPGYDDLKSIYFTQSKAPKKTTTATSLELVKDGYLYNYTSTSGVSVGSIDAGGNYNYTGTAVVFIDSTLSINGNITGTSNMGLVLIVGGDINIAPTVTQINAVLISAGHIYTGGSGCSQNAVTASQLVVNGSLISLNSSSNIVFCRNLGPGNTSPAELINNEPKYLVILRELFADTLQKWSEITQ